MIRIITYKKKKKRGGVGEAALADDRVPVWSGSRAGAAFV